MGLLALLLLLFGPWVAGAAERSPSSSLLWPLEIEPRAITGTFMEPRSAHWHAGLDLRTEGRIGAEVRSPAAGSVVRIRASAVGYGKAIYLRLDSGHTLVFAHLSAFAPPIQSRVTAAQARRGGYEQDLWVEAGEIRFERGELMALSGATGTGAPHLHLEVRGPDGRPRDPQEWLPADDHRAPELRRIRLVPLDPAARVEGEGRPWRAAPGDTLTVEGTVGVQVDAVDRTGTAPFTVMPKGFEMRVDGETRYRLVQRAFSFGEGRQMRLEVAFDPDDDGRGRWLRLYRRKGNELSHREGSGRLRLSPIASSSKATPEASNVHRLEVVAWDVHGHRDSMSVFLRTGAVPRNGQSPARGGREVVFAGDSDATISRGFASEALLLESVGPTGRSVRAWSEVQDPRFLVAGRRDATLVAASGQVELSDRGGDSLYEGGALWLAPMPDPAPPTADLVPLDVQFHLQGAGVAFRGALDASFALPWPRPREIGLYEVNSRGRWSAVDSVVDSLGGGGVVLRAEVAGVGMFVAARDTLSPRLADFVVAGKKVDPGVVLRPVARKQHSDWAPRWPVISLGIVDAGSGLDDAPVVTLDGALYPARWDPEEDRLYLEMFVDPGAGMHEMVVVARDRAGHRSSAELRFELRE